MDEGNVNFFTGKTPIWSQGDIPLALAIAPDGLAVAPTGKRYTNEYMLDHFNTWMAGPYYYTIWSDTQLRAIKEQGFDWNADGPCFGWLGCQCPIPAGVPMTQMDEVIAAALEAGILWEADSIEALAGKIGVDGDALAQTVASYNSYVDAGEDPEFGKAPEFLDSKVEGGRYYALKAVSYCYTIGGGLHVDTSLRVLDAGGQPIEGLIAAGTDAESGLYSPKKAYVTYGGSAAGWAWTSGYLAGATAAGLARGE